MARCAKCGAVKLTERPCPKHGATTASQSPGEKPLIEELRARADEAEAKIPGFECCDPQECYAPTIGVLVADVRFLAAALADAEHELIRGWSEDEYFVALHRTEAEVEMLRDALAAAEAAERDKLVQFALWISQVWEAENSDDVESAKLAVDAFLEAERFARAALSGETPDA
jgi:hypothetical protein